MDLEQKIREYITNVIHMSLGTSVDNKPWVCEVHFAFDNGLNLYFCSLPKTRHCQEIEQNPHASGAITVQHEPSEKPLGIYFEGLAKKVEAYAEDEPGFLAYVSRFPKRLDFAKEYADAEGFRLYKVTVSDFYMFDARESHPPQKRHLTWRQT